MTKLKARLGQMAVATMLATGLLVVAQIDSAGAAYPGKDGLIAIESNRTTGKGVDTPTGDTETFTVKPDGSVGMNGTQKPSNPDQKPSRKVNRGHLEES